MIVNQNTLSFANLCAAFVSIRLVIDGGGQGEFGGHSLASLCNKIVEHTARILEQHVGRIEFDHSARIEHKHSVRVDDGVQPMGNGQHSARGKIGSKQKKV